MPSVTSLSSRVTFVRLFMIVCLSIRLAADIVIIPAVSDGYIRESQPASQTANDGNALLLLGNTAGPADYLRVPLAFDVVHSALTAGTVNSVSLVLTATERDTGNGGSVDAARTVTLHALASSFAEPAVSWLDRDAGQPWLAPGGDFGPVLASVSANPGTVNSGDTLAFTGAAGLTSAVRDARGGRLHLLAKLAVENSTRAIFRLGSREGARVDGPRLVIDYTPAPAPPAPAPSGNVIPLPGHPERAISTRYTVTAGGLPVEVKAERYSFDVALFTLGAAPAVVDIAVTEDFTDFTLKPARHNLAVTRTGQTLRFMLAEPLRRGLQIPGRTPLALIATPPETAPPSPGDPDVLYFGPGTTVAGVIRPASHQTVYLAPGALVKGRIEAKNVSHVSVRGRGFLETEGYSTRAAKTHGILFENADHVAVEGIALRSYHTWWQTLFLNARDVAVSHVNLFGLGVNTDGVDIDAVKDFVVRDSFIRAEDDGLGWHSLDAAANGELITERALADNVVIWNTGAGNGVRIGASMETQLWRDITLRRLDILQHAGAGLYSDYSDWAWMQNLRFEDVTIERPVNPVIFQIAKTGYSNATGFLDERGHFDGLVFKNLVARGGAIKLAGFDATHRIDRVRFIHCVNAGVPLTSASQLTLNAFVTGLAFDEEPPPLASPLPGVRQAEDLESRTNRRPHFVAEETGAERVRIFLGAGPGDWLEHTLNVPAPGTFALKIRVRLTPSSGRASLTLDGAPVGPERDFHSPSVVYREFDYGNVSIPAAGDLALRLVVTGRNPASAGHRLDVDSFKLLTPLQDWRDRHFQTTADTGPADSSADPDADGAPNLVEFATGTPPLIPQPANIVASVVGTDQDRRLRLAFTRPEPAPVDYAVESSGDLLGWSAVASLASGSSLWAGPASVMETAREDGLRQVAVTDPADLVSSSRRFLRLKITHR